MQLEISAEERVVLERVVESALGEMRVEVRRTSTRKFHDELLADEGRLKAVLDRIKELGG